MTDPDPDRAGFLDRWSRRKGQARQGLPQPEPGQASAVPLPPQDAAPASQPEPALPTLEDVVALTRDSDFAPFVGRGVTAEVKNAALKKLFADPHYNLMDGLDVYIDDYSQLEPLPESMLRKMASARLLKLFDDTETDTGVQAGAGAAVQPAAPAGPSPALSGLPAPDSDSDEWPGNTQVPAPAGSSGKQDS